MICGPVKDGSGEMWGVLVVTGPLTGDTFDEESLDTFRSVSVCPLRKKSLRKVGRGLFSQPLCFVFVV